MLIQVGALRVFLHFSIFDPHVNRKGLVSDTSPSSVLENAESGETLS